MSFGETIFKLRREKGYTVREFARMVELSPAFISLLERGKTSALPTEENIRRMANILECDEYDLMAKAKRIPSELEEAFFKNPQKVVFLCRRLKGESDKVNEQISL